MVEPIQGEGGIYIADVKFLKSLRKICNKFNAVLIYDEIQCGMGRTGELFAYKHFGVEPDVITLAKSLANGLPLGATIIKGKHVGALTYGDHGSTFGGNPVASAAAIATLKALDGKMLTRAKKLGKHFISELDRLMWDFPKIVKEIRGVGLMIGIELQGKAKKSGSKIVQECAKNGLIINCTRQTVLRFLPPFIITEKDIDSALEILRVEFKKMFR
jgi:acetylornithine/succinyldiaminopimelate/putrescine aminotransferase